MQNRSALMSYFFLIVNEWRVQLANKSFRIKLLIVPVLFFLYSAITQQLSNFIEARKGVQLEDKLLYLLPSYDFSTIIFFLLYTSLLLLILTHLHKPSVIIRLVEMHFLVAVIRQICILLVALEPPVGIIVLRDVFLENTVYPHNTPLTKDLFFSGHVASLWIYFLCAEHRYLKTVFFIGTLLMSFMILSMRVHYTFDVLGAFFFTSLLYFSPTHIKPYFKKVKTQLAYSK
jgi:hypothetical protein